MKAKASRRCLYACLLVAAAAVSFVQGAAAQAPTCPSLSADDIGSPSTGQALWDGVIKACTSSSPASPAPPCGPCHCALVSAVAPRLTASGDIRATELYTAQAATTLAATLSSCMRNFTLEVLENTDLNIGQLTSMDVCTPDVRTVTQCLSQATASSDNSTATSANGTSSGQVALPAWTDLVRDASCALAAAANTDGVNATTGGVVCQMTTGASNWLQQFVEAPASSADGSSSSQGLAITSKTTRGPIRWKAGCWCDTSSDPVCDPNTRVQYPNPCSANCQYIAKTVPCSSLPPLVRQGRMPGTDGGSVLVFDNALFKSAPQQQAAAFDGAPAPKEADGDTQLFYYYYDDDADDSQDALDLSEVFVDALKAANIGANDAAAAAAAAANATIAATTTAPATPVTAQDGAADTTQNTVAGMLADALNMTRVAPLNTANNTVAGMLADALNVIRVGGLLANLPNLTDPITVVARVRDAVSNITGAAAAGAAQQPERRTTVRLNTANDPALPSWLSTGSPGLAPEVYSRNADRTSRILAALMASARESNTRGQTSAFVMQLTGGLDQVLKTADAAASARRASAAALGATPAAPAGAIAGGLLRAQAADGGNSTAAAATPVLSGVLEAARNSTGMLTNALNGTVASMLNGTIANATAALDAARPVLALGGARDTPILDQLDAQVRGFGDVVQQVGKSLRSAGDAVVQDTVLPTMRAPSDNSTAATNETSMAAMPMNATMTTATAADGADDVIMLSGNSTADANATAADAMATNATVSGSADGAEYGSDGSAEASSSGGRRRHRSRRSKLLL